MAITKEDILKRAQEQNVKFIRLQFTDILGVIKNIALPVSQLEKALDGEIMFDGSSIEGFVGIQESDMILKPDYNTFTIFPWRPQDGAVARLICDVYKADETPFEGDPRGALKRVLAEAKEMGFTMNVGPEPEFFLFLKQPDAKNPDGIPTNIPHDNAGYFDLGPVDLGEDARREMVITLQEMGFEVEASHHEVAPGQHEIDFKYGDALSIADDIETFKLVVRIIARNHGLHATFMPKPVFGINGSGMHMHQSLFTADGKNAFYDPNAKDGLSETALYYIGGILKHARGFAAITNPIVNSYKRLVPGYEAPVYTAWSLSNRSALVRIPARRGLGTRVELRNPDPACNPYLAIAATLKAGLDGIKNKIMPPEATVRNIYKMTAAERKECDIPSLPSNLKEALEELAKNEVIKSALGDHIFRLFMEVKEAEWDEYRTNVDQWELDKYLSQF